MYYVTFVKCGDRKKNIYTFTAKNYFMKVTKYSRIISFAFLLVLLCLSADLFARAGGGGGDGGGGGSGDGGLAELIFYILMMIPFPYNLIVIGIIIVIALLTRKKAKQASVMNKMPSPETMRDNAAFVRYKQNNPQFSEQDFRNKVTRAFYGIQDAWAAQDMKRVRKFISDGIYQRFNVQFIMMKKLQQYNELSGIQIHSMTVSDYKSDGAYDVIDVAIHASMTDRFVSKKIPRLSSGGYESFVEYWTFIKKSNAALNDIYENPNCPQCGAAIPEIQGETGICPYCKAVVNSGDFDWVLSEITQADDYTYSQSYGHKQLNLQMKIQKLFNSDEGFSVQKLEDKASNAFLQHEIALALRNPALARRFMREDSYQKLTSEIQQSAPLLYNRLYLNDVSLISHWAEGTMNYLGFFIRKSYQRLEMKRSNPDELEAIMDPVVRTQSMVIVLCRDAAAQPPKGLLYAHQCPNCGGTLSDTTDTKCPYCTSEVNSPNFDWVVDGVYSLGEYKQRLAGDEPDELIAFGVDKADDLLDVRDYAFNNVLIVLAADGHFATEEEAFAKALAKKLGYNPLKIAPSIQLAKSRKLVLRMPDDPKKHAKIIKLMDKAAMADQLMTPAEAELMAYVHNNFA